MGLSYCIVGGGISGLVAAYRLRRSAGPDASITLFDGADRLGGVLRTVRLGGQPFDIGAEAFITRRPEMPALLAELGLADRQIQTTGAQPSLYSCGQLHPLPQGAVQGIPTLASSMLDLVDNASIAQVLDERIRPLTWNVGADPTVAELVGDRFGQQVVTRSVDPLLAGVYAGSAASIGLRAAAPAVAVALDRGATSLTEAVRRALPAPVFGSAFGAVRGGYSVLVDELRHRAGAHWIQKGVQRIDSTTGGWEVIDEEGGYWPADAVVIAVPAPRLPSLIEHLAPHSAAAARRIPVASVAVVGLALPAGTPLPQQSGVLAASGEKLRCKAITLSSRKWGRCGDVELVRLSFGRLGDELARNATDDDLLSWAQQDLVTLFGIAVEPVDSHVHRWMDAIPQYQPGHRGVITELRAGLPPTLVVAGAYLDGVGVPACVGTATRAAESLLTACATR
ncbi:protoporphyrinogen oxidase [Mycolicibacterium neworleansense]|uniref:Coproporphyrinogen III oxidase n=1 Tax=Mycolicibacterium neworleansense TaxID=146018 RepID=A0A0H5S058_9MYCO|nr:protoporphyrinogen oxidase [Mycolicibacterium neworleansense]MCV7363424.1 protoporphyrinogen oxidase [Mycolicibacterium neworleansense]CRZ14364.1 protoporphyrinogen oxidase [Mycolicibacterium neworleansense]